MTAIDAAVQSKRLGADEVTIVYRRGEAEMKASGYERELARHDGVLIRHFAAPKALEGDAGRVTGVVFERMVQKDGALAPAGESFRLEADMVLSAIGQIFVAGRARQRPEPRHRGRAHRGRRRATHLAPRRLGRRRLRRRRAGSDRRRGRGRQAGRALDRSGARNSE